MLAETSETNRTVTILISSLVVLLLATLAVILFHHANQVRAAANALIAEEIAQEDRNFCGNFGIARETARHDECAKGLMEIRKRHLERVANEGVL
jgi:hypothetical protein